MQAVEKIRSRESLDFLLILRAFAGFAVVLHHVFACLPPPSWGTLWLLGSANITFLLEGCGQAGVALFFCLSGYLMAKGFYYKRYPTSARGIASFYRNRFLRIIPLYVFYIIIASTLGVTHAGSPTAFTESIWRLATFTYSAELADASTILFSHLWTISAEVQFYIIVPLVMLALLWRRPSQKVSLCALLVLLLGGTFLRAIVWHAIGSDYSKWNQSIYEPVWMNLDLFVGGMLLNFVSKKPFARVTETHASSYLTAILVFYLVAAYTTYEGLTMHVNAVAIDAFIIGLPSMTLIFALAMIYYGERMVISDVRVAWHFGMLFKGCKALEFVGKITFGVYLWHVAFIYRDWPYIPATTPLMLYFSVLISATCLTLITASVTHYGIELTSDRLKAGKSRMLIAESPVIG